MIKMLTFPLEKMDNMQDQMENFSREVETLRRKEFILGVGDKQVLGIVHVNRGKQ